MGTDLHPSVMLPRGDATPPPVVMMRLCGWLVLCWGIRQALLLAPASSAQLAALTTWSVNSIAGMLAVCLAGAVSWQLLTGHVSARVLFACLAIFVLASTTQAAGLIKEMVRYAASPFGKPLVFLHLSSLVNLVGSAGYLLTLARSAVTARPFAASMAWLIILFFQLHGLFAAWMNVEGFIRMQEAGMMLSWPALAKVMELVIPVLLLGAGLAIVFKHRAARAFLFGLLLCVVLFNLVWVSRQFFPLFMNQPGTSGLYLARTILTIVECRLLWLLVDRAFLQQTPARSGENVRA